MKTEQKQEWPLTRNRTTFLLVGALAFLAGCGGQKHDSWRLQGRAMVSAADPRAVKAGIDILERGGSAVDAAIAIHAVLGLVEPQSSGLGGGAFMLVYDRAQNETVVYDGRETAPKAVHPGMFMNDDVPMPFLTAWQSGRSIGVPGAVALYGAAHRNHGTLPWDSLFDSATQLASDGFKVSPRLASLLASKRLRDIIRLDDDWRSAKYFYPDGQPLLAGRTRTNPAYADTLRTLAAEGPDVFYSGEIVDNMIDRARREPSPSTLTAEDFSSYRVKRREPLCAPFRTYRICSAPPPASGGVAQSMILGLYDRFSKERTDASDEIGWIDDFVDAQRLAYADRDHYIADPDHVTVDADDLIAPDYLDARAQERFRPGQTARPGDPGAVLRNTPVKGRWGTDSTNDAPGTTHFSVVDFDGNAVSMTATIENIFGSSRLTKNGFLLNNELTDFAFIPVRNGKPVANAMGPGKRPRSSMSPVLVFDKNGELVMATGSPGGNSIIAYVAKSLIGVLDRNMSAQEATDYPNVIARGDVVRVEDAEAEGKLIAQRLTLRGHEVRSRRSEASGLHIIVARPGGYEGGADKRREGIAVEITEPAQ